MKGERNDTVVSSTAITHIERIIKTYDVTFDLPPLPGKPPYQLRYICFNINLRYLEMKTWVNQITASLANMPESAGMHLNARGSLITKKRQTWVQSTRKISHQHWKLVPFMQPFSSHHHYYNSYHVQSTDFTISDKAISKDFSNNMKHFQTKNSYQDGYKDSTGLYVCLEKYLIWRVIVLNGK